MSEDNHNETPGTLPGTLPGGLPGSTNEAPTPGSTEPGAKKVASASPSMTPTPASTPAAAPADAPAPAPAKPAPAAATTTATAAAKPKKAPPPPDPRAVAAKEFAQTVCDALLTALPEAAVEEVGAAHFVPMIRLRNQDWATGVEWLRTAENWKLNYVECMAGADYPTYIEIVLYVQSTSLGHWICLKTRTERDHAEVPSLVESHPSVNWEEREIFDLLGVKFTNHPDLRRIMMWDEFVGHPLRKDYSEWE